MLIYSSVLATYRFLLFYVVHDIANVRSSRTQKLNEANNEGKTKSFVAAKSHYRYVVGKME